MAFAAKMIVEDFVDDMSANNGWHCNDDGFAVFYINDFDTLPIVVLRSWLKRKHPARIILRLTFCNLFLKLLCSMNACLRRHNFLSDFSTLETHVCKY